MLEQLEQRWCFFLPILARRSADAISKLFRVPGAWQRVRILNNKGVPRSQSCPKPWKSPDNTLQYRPRQPDAISYDQPDTSIKRRRSTQARQQQPSLSSATPWAVSWCSMKVDPAPPSTAKTETTPRPLTTQHVGRLGELLVQYELLRYGIDSPPMTVDAGVDLVAYSGLGRRSVTIQVKTNLAPKPGGGKGAPAIDWWVSDDCPAEVYAFADLSTR